jgi:hypothetical protein
MIDIDASNDLLFFVDGNIVDLLPGSGNTTGCYGIGLAISGKYPGGCLHIFFTFY